MPTELLLTIAITSGLSFAILFLRVPAFAVLFSLLVGQVLSTQASTDVYQFVADVTNIARYEYVQIALLVVPFVLTIVFLRGRAPKSKLAFEFLPAVFASLTLLLLLYPLLPFVKNLLDIASRDQIEAYGSLSLVIASILGLISVWISFPKPHKDKHDK